MLYEQNADRHFVPASTIKLATVAAALYFLGPSYRFKTYIYTEKWDPKQRLVTNLYLQGSGDPSLTDHDLADLASELKQQNINQIQGDIYLDDYVFDDTFWVRGTMWDDRKFGFGAPTSGLNFNYNRILIKTIPGALPTMPAQVIIKPFTKYLTLSSGVKTTGKKSKKDLYLAIKNTHEEKAWANITSEGLSLGDHVIINGTIPASSEPAYSLLAVKDPRYTRCNLSQRKVTRAKYKLYGQNFTQEDSPKSHPNRKP